MTTVAQGQSVLVVDDEPGVRALLGRVLREAGFLLDEASDGDEALTKLARCQSDIVVIDIIMPGREGVETILEIRKRWPNTYIVAISGAGLVGGCDILELARAIGADRVLSKPFRPAQILELLAEGPVPQAAA